MRVYVRVSAWAGAGVGAACAGAWARVVHLSLFFSLVLVQVVNITTDYSASEPKQSGTALHLYRVGKPQGKPPKQSTKAQHQRSKAKHQPKGKPQGKHKKNERTKDSTNRQKTMLECKPSCNT